VKFASFAKCRDQPGSDTVPPIPEGEVTNDGTSRPMQPAPELAPLGVFIGRWITEGETVGDADAPAARIVASDVYQWVPGGRFVMHPAYGRIGSVPVGGLEVIGYDASTGHFETHFFDSNGNAARETLSCRDGVWTWQGSRVRCRGVFSDDGRTLTAHHERSEDGEHWRPSMTVVLRKID
jgi:hypothetical protein